MRTLDEARTLAERMVAIGRHAGRRVAALLSSMQQPLGHTIGNALEVREAIAALRGNGPADLVELCLALGTQLALLAGKASNEAEARALLHDALDSGAAWAKFRQMVAAQGGDTAAIDEPERLPQAPVRYELKAPHAGFIHAIDGMALGLAVNALGGGRAHKDDRIDLTVGLDLRAKVGEQVATGAPLLAIHAASEEAAAGVVPRLLAAFTIDAKPAYAPPLIEAIVS
jgi:pyrimidine-nucleoside phosphorylase